MYATGSTMLQIVMVGSPQATLTRDVAAVIREHGPYVWRTVLALGVPPQDVPDVCQEVFLVVHRRLQDFEGRSRMSTWLYGICLRTVSGYRRSRSRKREAAVDEMPEVGVAPTQERQVERTKARARLMAAIDVLDADKREVFVLFEVEGLPMAEIAAILGCPRRTVYSRLEAARTILRREWKRSALATRRDGTGEEGTHGS